MKIIPYGRQSIDENDIKEVVKVLRGHWITQGPKINEFEDVLCKYTGASYAVAVSSGTAALHIACLAAGISKNDEVITSPITFAASANSVLYCGGRPVFADVQPDTANIDPEEINKKIGKKTKAIMPVHFAGHPCDMEKIKEIADKRGLIVIEDAAHALGAEYKRSRIGSCRYSDMAVFSFHPVKTITTGEGGAVLTNSSDLYEKLIDLRGHGIVKESKRFIGKDSFDKGGWYYEMQRLGFNYRITDFQCALGKSQLNKMDNFLKKRKDIFEAYNGKLSRFPEFILPVERPYVNSARHLYCLKVKRFSDRKIVFDHMRKRGIGVQVHYMPVYMQPYYRKIGYTGSICPRAERFYSQEISIPVYYDMTDKDVSYVVKVLKETCE